MSRLEILVIHFPEADADWPNMVKAVESPWMDDDHFPQFKIIESDSILKIDEQDKKAPLAWLICHEQGDPHDLYAALEHLADLQMPVIISRYGDPSPTGTTFQDGVVTARTDESPDKLRLMIQTLISQSQLISQMRRDIHITRRHHGGLANQMIKLDEEMRLAARVQQEFLPDKLPQVGPVETHVFYRPAGYVSGDIYDVARLDEDHIGFWIADVVGHGVPAALFTMFVKRALPTKEISNSSYRLVPPDEALWQLNDEMYHRASGSVRFATAVYGLLNCRTLELQMARAGHPYPLLLKADNTVEKLDADGPLLGVFPDGEFTVLTKQLELGDRILLFSDGFEFAFEIPEDQKDNNDYYMEQLANLRHHNVDQALIHLEQQIDQQPGSLNQQDDLTALLIGVGCPASLTTSNADFATTQI